MDNKSFWKNQNVPFGKLQKLCELRSELYIVTKVITKVNYEIALDADPTRTHIVNQNHLVEFICHENELPNLLSNYEKLLNDDRYKQFFNGYARKQLCQLNHPIDWLVEWLLLNDYLPIFLDACGPSRKDKSFCSPVNDNSCHSTPKFLANSLDSGIAHSSPHTTLSFQLESTILTTQPTTFSPSRRTSSINPNTFQSISTGTTPHSRNTGTLPNYPSEWYEEPYF